MKKYAILYMSLIMVILIISAGIASAEDCTCCTCLPQGSTTSPDQLQGCGPTVYGYGYCTNPCVRCGAFCIGDLPVGWPYDFCSEYWLRPNSNF